MDAIVGTTFCVGVIGMYHSGIGGGGFALIRDVHGNYEAVDFRETAPAAAYEDMYGDDKRLSIVGGLAVGVPGEVLGLEYMHTKYGVSSDINPEMKLRIRGERCMTDDGLCRSSTGALSCRARFALRDMALKAS